MILSPPSTGSDSSSSLLSAIPEAAPVFSLGQPGGGGAGASAGSMPLTEVAGIYAGEIHKHIRAKEKEIVFIGVSSGAVVAAAMLQRLLADKAMCATDLRLVLVNPAIPGSVDDSGSQSDAGMDADSNTDSTSTPQSDSGIRNEYFELTEAANEPVRSTGISVSSLDEKVTAEVLPVPYIQDPSIQALSKDIKRGHPLFKVKGKGILARHDRVVRTKLWWESIVPELQWEELGCTREELWPKCVSGLVVEC